MMLSIAVALLLVLSKVKTACPYVVLYDRPIPLQKCFTSTNTYPTGAGLFSYEFICDGSPGSYTIKQNYYYTENCEGTPSSTTQTTTCDASNKCNCNGTYNECDYLITNTYNKSDAVTGCSDEFYESETLVTNQCFHINADSYKYQCDAGNNNQVTKLTYTGTDCAGTETSTEVVTPETCQEQICSNPTTAPAPSPVEVTSPPTINGCPYIVLFDTPVPLAQCFTSRNNYGKTDAGLFSYEYVCDGSPGNYKIKQIYYYTENCEGTPTSLIQEGEKNQTCDAGNKCNCDGSVNECYYVRTNTYDECTSGATCAEGCSTVDYESFTVVLNQCFHINSESFKYLCDDNNDLTKLTYSGTDCAGDATLTSVPTDTCGERICSSPTASPAASPDEETSTTTIIDESSTMTPRSSALRIKFQVGLFIIFTLSIFIG